MHPLAHTLKETFRLFKFEWLLVVLGLGLWFAPMWWLPGFVAWGLLALGIVAHKPERWKVLAGIFALSPFCWVSMYAFGQGTVDYIQDEAVWRTVGLPSDDYSFVISDYPFQKLNPHRTYRVPVISSGCLVDGSEVFTHMPYNSAVGAWTTIFGYIDGAYDGPYPQASEAYDTLRDSEASIHRERLGSDAARESLGLQPKLANALREHLGPTVRHPRIRYARLRGDTLLLAPEGNFTREWRILLIDLEHQRVIAAFMDHRAWSDEHDSFAAFSNSQRQDSQD